MIEYKILSEIEKVSFAESFMESSSIAHKNTRRDFDWFSWKFMKSPYGPSIISCAIVEDKVVGVAAYGIYPFIMGERRIEGAIPYETFVHPDYQGKGIFKKMIKVFETEAAQRKIQLLVAFPNNASLQGFVSMGWTNENIQEYRIKVINYGRVLLNFKNIKAPFKGDPKSADTLPLKYLPARIGTFKLAGEFLSSRHSVEYLKWRFFLFPNAQYDLIETEDFIAISRIGFRKKLKEVNLIFVVPQKGEYKKQFITEIISSVKKRLQPDLIGISLSKVHPLLKEVRASSFLKVPNKVNMCYKVLDSDLKMEDAGFCIAGIDFHTY